MDYDEVEPRCDICEEPEWCGKDMCPVCSNNWNGETGNHISCEEKNPDYAEFYAQLTAG
jgi:hypothetical protein